jgi:hypothetical protein
VKIRLMGLPEECLVAIEALQSVFVVVEINGPYLNHGESSQVRYFIETRGDR